jgi:AcrR family transcriptional regulator
MTELAEFKRGPGGRPTREESERRHGALLENAMRLFLERGYEATTVEEIAKRTGVAKRFIYARYGDKSELFVAAVEQGFLNKLEHTIHAIEPSRHGAEQGLYEFGRTLLQQTLQPDALAMHRLFLTSASQFPDVARRFVERTRERFLKEIQQVLAFYAERGEIELRDPQLMIECLLIAIVGIPQRLAMMGIRETPEDGERRLRVAVRLFVNGCKPARKT